MKRIIFLLALCLLLPALALAVTEGVVETAPQVEIELGFFAEEMQESYLPEPRTVQEETGWMLSQTYIEQASRGGDYEQMTSMCRLTSGETYRANRLLEAYVRGEATGHGERVLNAEKNVVVGVYPLDEEDYDGENVLLLLPGTMLSDAQILDLCYNSGFSSLSWMYSLFRSKFGCSPAAFRKKYHAVL